jgi:hypothetical protein
VHKNVPLASHGYQSKNNSYSVLDLMEQIRFEIQFIDSKSHSLLVCLPRCQLVLMLRCHSIFSMNHLKRQISENGYKLEIKIGEIGTDKILGKSEWKEGNGNRWIRQNWARRNGNLAK